MSVAPAWCRSPTVPFGPGQLGYLEDSGFPQYDLAAAQDEMDECLADLGTEHIEFTFNTTNDPFNVETNTLVISMWTEVVRRRGRTRRSPRSSRASTSGSRSSARSTPSAGATTAASTPPPRPTGGRAASRARSGRWRSTSVGSRTLTSTPPSTRSRRTPIRPARTGSRRGDQPDLRRAGVQPVDHVGPVGCDRAAVRQWPREQRAASTVVTGCRPGVLRAATR